MGAPPVTRGAVVLVRFPFSDLSDSKRRPAVVLADAGRGDAVLVQVTSRPYGDPAVELQDDDFETGGLDRTSFARPGKLFTANDSIVDRPVGALTAGGLERLVDAVVALIRGAA